MKHTSEPWKVQFFNHQDDLITHTDGNEEIVIFRLDRCNVDGRHEDDQREDMKRLVSCVNACAGINPEVVPMMAYELDLLLRAIDGLVDDPVLKEKFSPYIKPASEALAKARGAE